MSKIVRMEDIIDIVGMKNYIEALNLNIDDLKYLGSEPSGSKMVLFNFQYHERENTHLITLTVDGEKNVKDVRCDCENFNMQDYCSHIALVIMQFLANEELVDQGLSILKNRYDEEFNQYLFSNFVSNSNKKQLRVEIILRPIRFRSHFEYELVVKIGDEKLYILKKQLEDFLDNYPNGLETISFGKNFAYSNKDYMISRQDQPIFEFLKFYVDSQQQNHYYGYYGSNKVTFIQLSKNTLTEFLKLLSDHPFKVEEGYHTYSFEKIRKDYPFHINMDEINNDLRVVFHYAEITPLTEDYQFFIDGKNCYQVSKEVGSFLKVIMKNRKQQLLFRESEFKNFSDILLPKIYELDPNLKMTKEVEEKFILEIPKVKYYFERKQNKIEAQIHLFTSNYEWKLSEEAPIYVIRNKEQEQIYEQELLDHHFQWNEKKRVFELLYEDDIVSFLEIGLKELTEKYEIYVSKDLKEIRIIKKTNIQSQFGIGKDHILSYQFDIDHVDKKEINSLLDAVRFKKKYYRLKNGDYINIRENQELEQMNALVEELELSPNELVNNSISIPKYKSLQIERIVSEENMGFVKFDSSFEEMIETFKQYKNTDVSLSKQDLLILRDYQEIGVKWMMTIANCGFGGILADEMGLGKSIQTIIYIKLRLKQNPNAKFLIIVPTSLVYNWENEFKKFERNISILLVNGNKEKRQQILKKAKEFPVIITSYGLLRQDIDEYQEMLFDTCLIDEAQNIKNLNTENTKACKMIHADIKFALTGTPIENSILELWSIFDFIMPGYLSSLLKFKRTYSPKEIEETPELLHQLNHQISPFILRRKKIDVLKDLPEKLENQILVELTDNEKKLYIGQLERTKEQIEQTIKKDGFMKSQILILSLLMKLRQICIDQRLLVENENQVGSKIKTLLEIVKGSISNGHKILVFSQFPSALQLVQQELDNEKISYYYLDGSTSSKKRIEMVTSFNQNDTKIFLISLKAGGTGLNLTSADIVIHLDPWWNPQVENQATDRAHRIGQKHVVEVIKLIAKGTIEEKIIELQNKKKNLSDQVIEGEDRDQIILSKLTEKELRSLLES